MVTDKRHLGQNFAVSCVYLPVSDSSETLERIKAKQHYIPGLNYVGDKQSKKPAVETSFTSQKPTKQNEQTKPVSQSGYKQSGFQYTPLLPTPTMKQPIIEDNQ